MISKDIAVVDVHPDHWVNFRRGARRTGERRTGRKRRGWLLIVQHADKVVHAVVRGEARPELIGLPVSDLRNLRRKYQTTRAVCVERDFLRRALTRGESKLSYDMDYVEQVLTYVKAFRTELGSGMVIDPPTPNLPIPPFAAIQFAFDRLWPDNSSIVWYVIDEDRQEVFTSLILRKTGGDLDLLTTDLHLAGQGLHPAAWKTDRQRVLELVKARVAPVYLALFENLSAWRALRGNPPGSGAFRRLRASGDVIVEPFPHRLALLSFLSGLVTKVVGYAKRK